MFETYQKTKEPIKTEKNFTSFQLNMHGKVEESLYQSCLQLKKKKSQNCKGIVWSKVQVYEENQSGKGRGNALSEVLAVKKEIFF